MTRPLSRGFLFVRLVVRPFRFELLAVVAAIAVVTVAGFLVADELHRVGDVATCLRLEDAGPLPDGSPCGGMLSAYMRLQYGDAHTVMNLFQFLPLAVGMILGVPIVAREIELGTAPFTWSMTPSRRRWLFGRLAVVLPILIVALSFAVFSAESLEAASSPTVDPGASFSNYGTRGILMLGWGVLALAVAALVGATMGRTLPAVVVSAAIVLALHIAANPLMFHYLKSEGTPAYAFHTVPSVQEKWLVTRSALALDLAAYDARDQLITRDAEAWVTEHGKDPQYKGFDVVPMVIPGRDYFWAEARETTGLLFLAALAIGTTFFVVSRRRP